MGCVPPSLALTMTISWEVKVLVLIVSVKASVYSKVAAPEPVTPYLFSIYELVLYMLFIGLSAKVTVVCGETSTFIAYKEDVINCAGLCVDPVTHNLCCTFAFIWFEGTRPLNSILDGDEGLP